MEPDWPQSLPELPPRRREICSARMAVYHNWILFTAADWAISGARHQPRFHRILFRSFAFGPGVTPQRRGCGGVSVPGTPLFCDRGFPPHVFAHILDPGRRVGSALAKKLQR